MIILLLSPHLDFPEALWTRLDIESQLESLKTVEWMKIDYNFITYTRSSDKISKLKQGTV